MSAPSAPKNGSLCWHQIPVKDLARAKAFYTTVLAITFSPPMPGAADKGTEHLVAAFNMTMDGSMVGGNLFQVPEEQEIVTADEKSGMTLYFFVYDIEGTLKKVEENGGRVVKGVHEQGEMGMQAFVVDTEGNFFGVWQPNSFDFTKCTANNGAGEKAE